MRAGSRRSGPRWLLTANVKLLFDDPMLTALVSTDSNCQIATLKMHLFPAPPKAYTTEHLSLTLAMCAVPFLRVTAAISHINEHSSHESHHTDCIVTELAPASSTFVRGVDSARVFVNTSTHFADGFRYGFGQARPTNAEWPLYE
jgi:glutamate-5-semialdehyde dehydrogenase